MFGMVVFWLAYGEISNVFFVSFSKEYSYYYILIPGYFVVICILRTGHFYMLPFDQYTVSCPSF